MDESAGLVVRSLLFNSRCAVGGKALFAIVGMVALSSVVIPVVISVVFCKPFSGGIE